MRYDAFCHPQNFENGGFLEMAKKWIAGAIRKPGQLHRDLGVPQGQKIPPAKVEAAAKRGGKVGQRARLAKTLKKLGK
jgi:hypothetical protein